MLAGAAHIPYNPALFQKGIRAVTHTKSPAPGRIRSLDQLRGYTIFGMILVNYLGQFPSMPETFRHHDDYMSYADTIAPLFLFVAGVGFRLSYLRNRERLGLGGALWTGLRRYLTLTLIGILFYNPLNWRGWWDALVDIGLSGVLALPFIGLGPRARIAAACGYLALFQALFTLTPYGAWNMANSYDGGPLGPLSWVFSLLLGTVLYDLAAAGNPRRLAAACLAWGAGLCAAGWLLHTAWPGMKDVWNFSQRDMTAPYPLFATGLAFLAYLPFYLLCDVWGRGLPTLDAVGSNPLVLYLLQLVLIEIHGTVIPQESGAAAAALAFAGMYTLYYLTARWMQRKGYYVKV